MAPPGRRRTRLFSFALLFSFLLLFTTTASAASAVLGIDLGTEYIKAVLVKPGIPLDIVLTKDSKRKEASAIAFKPGTSSQGDGRFPERLYGSDALALGVRYPGDVYPNLKPLLGIPFDDSPAVSAYGKRHPAVDMVAMEGAGTAAVRSGSFGSEETPFSVEELLAMELKNVRDNAKALAGKGHDISNAVITIPSFYTADERRAVELAAELAGLKVMGLVSDGLAVGINYATSRTFPSVSEGGKPEYHLVFDMGAGSTTATVLKFQGRAVKDVGKFNKTIQEVIVLGTGWDRPLGGDSLNDIIVDHMLGKFLETPSVKKLDVNMETLKAHPRATAKLWKEAQRIRQVLSANSDASASFEGLYDDIDFRYKLSRQEFEDLASDFAIRIEKPVNQALELAKLSMADLDSVILHGGAVRTPFVQKTLENLVGNPAKLRSNVNADEAAVFGAAFKGAGLSPSFKVKEIRDADTASYAVSMQSKSDGKDRRQRIFVPTSPLGTVKHVPVKNVDDFEFTLYQTVPSDGAYAENDRPVVKVETKNLTDSVKALVNNAGCARENITTSFSIQLNAANGLPEVTQGTISCEAEEKKGGGMVEDVKGFFGFGSKKDEQEPLKEAEQPNSESQENNTEPSSASSSPAEPTESKVVEDAKQKPPKTKTESINLRFVSTSQGLPEKSADQVKRMKQRLSAFDASDRSRRVREEVLNTLEAATYRARDYLSDEDFIAASTPSQRSELEDFLQSTGEWLYGDGARADVETLKSRQKSLDALVNPIKSRREEASIRPEQIRQLQESLDQTAGLLKMIKESIEKAAEVAASASSASSETSASDVPAAQHSSSDPLAELEEPDPSSSTSTTATSTPTPIPEIPQYTEEDLKELTSIHSSISSWLTTKIAEQDKLASNQDPVLKSADLTSKATQLNGAIVELLQRKIRAPPRGKAKTGSGPKAKGKAKKGAEKESRPSGEEKVAESPAADAGPGAEENTPGGKGKASPSKHDEL